MYTTYNYLRELTQYNFRTVSLQSKPSSGGLVSTVTKRNYGSNDPSTHGGIPCGNYNCKTARKYGWNQIEVQITHCNSKGYL